MDKTKIFLIVNYNLSYSTVVGFTLDKRDAEFVAWKKNQERNRYSCSSFSVDEVEACVLEKGKDYQKFIEDRRKQIKREIEEKTKCKVNDEKAVADLESELKSYA